ncbi:hypothetical protein O7543_29710 [Solwaraspora sp. WMMA2080]|uniref:hypothetical protein n=1 Tax=unclassified Solwaraspora TaxID=2627926 RepID=UPI00248D3A37|nr:MULTISPECIES: hypothetical protein [unclassified Solwaraspora]WBB95228.1 hypothetical protein O7553_17640 [Solwaraspora sp. WMMA2059]WBC20866.1 hypothetical protein O7543_29710 [Solwaraspora sp. WMMA2080]
MKVVRTVILVVVSMCVGAGVALLVGFLRGEGLERASWWAAVASLVLGVVTLAVQVLLSGRSAGSDGVGSTTGAGVDGGFGPVDGVGAESVSVGDVEVSGDRVVGFAFGGTVITGDGNSVGSAGDGRA